MQRSTYSRQSPSVSSATSTQRSAASLQRSPVPPGYEYLGRLVTRERPRVQKSKSTQQASNFSQVRHQQQYIERPREREIYEDASYSSSDDGIDNADGLSKPVGIIRINDRHLREIYRLPTPPPKVKRVYHRLRSPETKIIERVFVRRPPPQIIENVIEVPPEKVRIVNREKYIGKSKPITRSKLVHLQARDHEDEEEEERGREQTTEPVIIPAEQYSQPQSQPQPQPQAQPQQQTSAIPTMTGQCYVPQQQIQTTTFTHSSPQGPTTSTTAMVYPPQPNMPTVGYIQSSMPPHMMFNTQQALQLPSPQTPQPTPYTFVPQQTVSHQMMRPTTTYNYTPQTSTMSMLPFGQTRY